tara:strand:+ start:436 stop:765 length:330 start_codon:yes stop_codon:yes gene_type:complete
MVEFIKGYNDFKVWHTNKWNIFCHFITSKIQLMFFILFFTNYNFYYLLGILLIPYLTDGIGHLIEKNFRIVLLVSKFNGSTNSAGVNGFYNFLYRIMLGLETTKKWLKL